MYFVLLVRVFKFTRQKFVWLVVQPCIEVWQLVFAHLFLLLQQRKNKNYIVVPKLYNFHPVFNWSWDSSVILNLFRFFFVFKSCFTLLKLFQDILVRCVFNGGANFKPGTALFSFGFIYRSSCLTWSFLSCVYVTLFWPYVMYDVNVVLFWTTINDMTKYSVCLSAAIHVVTNSDFH